MYTYTLIFDSEILFKIKPNCAPDINEMGYRDSSFDHPKSEDFQRILFLGDSFVMGHNVEPDKTIAAALDDTLGAGHEVFNMGVLAYGPDQSLLALLDHGLGFDPDLVILSLFAPNDFQDIYRNSLFAIDDEGLLVRSRENIATEMIPGLRTLFLFDHLQYLAQPHIDEEHRFLGRRFESLYHHLIEDFYDWELLGHPERERSKKKVDLMRAILATFKAELSRRHIAFAVVNIPSYQNVVDPAWFETVVFEEKVFQRLQKSEGGFLGPENLVAELCEELGIPSLNLHTEFMKLDEEQRNRMYDEEDWHLSVEGNRFAAELVAAILVE
jgi:hypothetical protein